MVALASGLIILQMSITSRWNILSKLNGLNFKFNEKVLVMWGRQYQRRSRTRDAASRAPAPGQVETEQAAETEHADKDGKV